MVDVRAMIFADESRCILDHDKATCRRYRHAQHYPQYASRHCSPPQHLKLLQADKEGGFVLAPTTVYKEKADAAVTENFQVANVKPSKVKATASKLCEEAGLHKLASSVRAARGVNLSVFFSAKTHKPEVPFRVIVSEQGTWQRLVGRYLQRSLSVLPVEDPCLIRKPQIVSEFLQQECPSEVSFFSVDVKDLYYSLPMDQVCAEHCRWLGSSTCCQSTLNGVGRHCGSVPENEYRIKCGSARGSLSRPIACCRCIVLLRGVCGSPSFRY
ncbi:hypothetical protein HPB51_024318 [Rhipicephalus microplus]|uniref:Tick transposon n=1 Tax=Rhipicephalus microplus TaxID=6941 RepID=A0A9J6DY05_RHIMP|nr:hypothetical protein HPB51_024318 [Rhipicephalus microplus]